MGQTRSAKESAETNLPTVHPRAGASRGAPPLAVATTALVALLTACSGPAAMLVGGETVRDPGPPDPMLNILVLAADDLAPLAGAEVDFNGKVREADPAGLASTVWYQRSVTVRAAAPGFEAKRFEVVELPPEEAPVEVTLTPIVVSGEVVTPLGDPVEGAVVALGNARAVTGFDGAFRLNRAVPGLMTVTRAAWDPTSREWSGRTDEETFVLEPRSIRGIRVNPNNVGTEAVWQEFLAMAADSDINAFILDTKDESGLVSYDTGVAKAYEIGAVSIRYDAREALADMRRAGIYAITRIVTFQDNFMARTHPEWAVRNANSGLLWVSNHDHRWMDPTDHSSWQYPLDLAVEACELGFDEIQFDYVRFPTDGPVELLQFDGAYDEANRVATIAAFLAEARDRLNHLGCAVAADVFAITVSTPDDQGVGQRPEELSTAVDVLSPMIYPTHYTNGWLGFDEPNDHPAEVVANALDSGLPRMQGSAILRPWLQTSTYGPSEVVLEVDEAVARRLGWMLWQSLDIFDVRLLPRYGNNTEAAPAESPPEE